jgi:hypothetical protein
MVEEKPAILIRLATPADVEFIAEAQCIMCRETEGRELSKPTVSNGVLHCIQDPKLGVFYVAYLATDTE